MKNIGEHIEKTAITLGSPGEEPLQIFDSMWMKTGRKLGHPLIGAGLENKK